MALFNIVSKRSSVKYEDSPNIKLKPDSHVMFSAQNVRCDLV